MSDLTLSDGREFTVDLNKLTIVEWRELLKPEQPQEEEFACLAKVIGVKPEDVAGMGYLDFKLLGAKVFEKARNPVSDPNSSSESSSTTKKDTPNQSG